MEDSFPIHKIHTDLFAYLDEMSFIKCTEDTYVVPVFNKDSHECLGQSISLKDDISVISYSTAYRFAKDFYYRVLIGIGVFTSDPEHNSFFTIEKCLVELNYNDDLTLYDAEFYMTNLNRVEDS